MKSHFDLTDLELESKLAEGSLPTHMFTHEAHLRLAWMNIKEYGIESAVGIVCEQITGYVDHVGASDKFNRTLTIAAVKVVNHFMERSKANSFADFMDEFPRLKTNFRDLISTHYGFDIYHSEKARTEYLEPDLLPFD